MPKGPKPMSNHEADLQRARVTELENRIEIIAGLGDDELGAWTRLDWILSTLFGAVLPLLVMYWFAP